MDDVLRGKTKARGDFALSDFATAEIGAGPEKLAPRRTVNGAVHAASAQKRTVGGIDDGVDGERRDVGAQDPDVFDAHESLLFVQSVHDRKKARQTSTHAVKRCAVTTIHPPDRTETVSMEIP